MLNKLTQQEARFIIQDAWKEVVKSNYGMYRYGECLMNSLTNYVGSDNVHKYGVDALVCDSYHYAANCDVVMNKFYEDFVEEN